MFSKGHFFLSGIIVLLGFAASASAVHAATIYVNFSASSNGTGTESSPYNTITSVESVLAAGDTVYMTGNTNEAPGVNFDVTNKDGTSSAPTTLTQWPGQSAPVIDTGGRGLYINNSDYVVISNLTIQNSGEYGLVVEDSDNVTVSSVTISGSAGNALQVDASDNFSGSGLTVSSQGIVIGNGSLNGTIEDSTIQNLTGASGYGIFIGLPSGWSSGANTGWTFSGLTISNIGNIGITCQADSDNLTIEDTTVSSAGVTTSSVGINLSACDNVTISNTTVSSSSSSGMSADTVSNLTIEDSTISSNSSHGISLRVITTGMISGNTISSNTSHGINTSGASTNLTITDNTIYNNSSSGIWFFATGAGHIIDANTVYGHTSSSGQGGQGIAVGGATAPILSNNVAYGNRNGFLLAATTGALANAVLVNNVSYNNSVAAVNFSESGGNSITGVTIENNAFTTATDRAIYNYGNGDGPTWSSINYNNYQLVGSAAVMHSSASALADWRTLVSGDASSLALDPLFVSTTSGSENFHVQDGSPLIDAGKPAATLPTTDRDGNTRAYGESGVFDIGAYEYQAPASTGVSLAGTSSRNGTTYSVSLTITDATNDIDTTYYAIAVNGTSLWLDGNGGTTTSPVYQTSRTWTHENVTVDATYAYRLRIAYGSSPTTYLALLDPESVTIARGVPSAPTGLQSTVVSQRVHLDWTDVDTATSYTVSYGNNLGASDLGTMVVTDSEVNLEGLQGGRRVYWKVLATNDAGNGEYSRVKSFRPKHFELVLTPQGIHRTQVRVVRLDGTQITQFVSFGDLRMEVKAVTGDFNNDGEMDVAVAPHGPENAGMVVRFFNLRTGVYEGEFRPYRNDRGGVDIVAGNFNDSAGDDLAIVPWRGDSELRTYRFRTDFVPVLLDEVVTHGVETGGFQLSSGDYNGDGRPDVAIASRNRMTDVRVYRYSRGSEEWQLLGWLYPYPQGDSGSQMDSGDVNGDGMDDLVFVANTTTEQANLQAYTFDGSSTKDKSFRQTRGFRRIDGRWIDAVSDAFVGPFTLSVGNLFGQSRDEIVLGSSDGFIRVVGLQEGVFRVMDRYLPFPMWQSRVTPNILPTGHRSGERLFLTDNEDSLIQVLRWSEGNLVKLRSFYGFDEDASFGTVVGR